MGALAGDDRGIWVVISDVNASASPRSGDTITIKIGRVDDSSGYTNVDTRTTDRVVFANAEPIAITPITAATAAIGSEWTLEVLGSSTRNVLLGSQSQINSLYAVDESHIWAGTRQSQLWHPTNLASGQVDQYDLDSGAYIRGVWQSADKLFLATDTGLRTVSVPLDPGATNTTSVVAAGEFSQVRGVSTTEAFASGAGGKILHYDGATWQAQPSGTTDDVWALAASSSTDAWAGTASGLLHYDGKAWAALAEPGPTSPQRLAVKSDGSLWATASGVLYRRSPGPVHTR